MQYSDFFAYEKLAFRFNQRVSLNIMLLTMPLHQREIANVNVGPTNLHELLSQRLNRQADSAAFCHGVIFIK